MCGSWRWLCTLSAALFLALGIASASGATPIGPSCGSCAGAIWDLTYVPVPVATTATTETWAITLSVDATTFSFPGSFIDAVAIKVTSGSAFVSAALVSAPAGIGSWLEVTGGINAFGCSGSGAGFECARDVSPPNAAPVSAANHSWTWHVTVQTGTLLTGPNQADIKARFVDASGNRRGPLLSEDITLSAYNIPTPEPGQLGLLAAGLAAVLWRRRG